MNFGKPLDNSTIRRGLVELNPDICFDLTVALPSTWSPVIPDPQSVHKRIHEEESEPIYWGIRYITSLDRGMVPEHTLSEGEEDIVEIPMVEMDRYDDSSILYFEILPTDPFFNEALLRAESKSDNFYIDRGKVFKRQCVRMAIVPGRIIKLGWRSTFKALASAGIPGVTRRTLELKFGVDLNPMITSPEPQAAPVGF